MRPGSLNPVSKRDNPELEVGRQYVPNKTSYVHLNWS